MGFGEAFLNRVDSNPEGLFISQGKVRLNYRDAYRQIKLLDSKKIDETALRSNSIESVFSWLSLEISRESNPREVMTDYVTTSGSTGKPKQFYVSQDSQLVTARAINEIILNNEELTELLVLPLAYSSARGRLRAAILRGAPLHLATNPFRFSSIDFEELNRLQYAMATTPSTFRYLSQMLGGDIWRHFRGLRNLEFGSAELREAEQHNLTENAPEDLRISMHYGLSEASRSFLRNVRETKWNSLGTPMPHTRHELSEEGELIISGPHIASLEISEKGKFDVREIQTGDHCITSPEGEILLVGRLKNTINCGGKTMYIEQLESELAKNRELSTLAIGKASDAILGEVPVIFVPKGLRSSALIAWGRLDHNYRTVAEPLICEIVNLPTLLSGKIDRITLNEIANKNYSSLGK